MMIYQPPKIDISLPKHENEEIFQSRVKVGARPNSSNVDDHQHPLKKPLISKKHNDSL